MVVCEEGSRVVDTCRGGVLSLCFSRSLKKLVGSRDQVSSNSCVVARRLWYSGTLVLLCSGRLGMWMWIVQCSG